MKRSYAYEHVTSRSSSERATYMHMIPGLVSRSGARVGDGGDVRDGARYLSPQNARGESRREPLCDATRGRDDGGAAHVHRAVRNAEDAGVRGKTGRPLVFFFFLSETSGTSSSGVLRLGLNRVRRRRRRGESVERATHELERHRAARVVHARPDGDARHAARGTDAPTRVLSHDRDVFFSLEHLHALHVGELRAGGQLAERGFARGEPRVLGRDDRRGGLERDHASRPGLHGHRDAPRRGGRVSSAVRGGVPRRRGESRENRDSTRRDGDLAPGAVSARLGCGRGRLRGSTTRHRSGGHARGVECATRARAFSFVSFVSRGLGGPTHAGAGADVFLPNPRFFNNVSLRHRPALGRRARRRVSGAEARV